MLTEKDITEFQAMCKSELGLDVSREQATEEANNLLSLFKAVYRPIPPDDS